MSYLPKTLLAIGLLMSLHTAGQTAPAMPRRMMLYSVDGKASQSDTLQLSQRGSTVQFNLTGEAARQFTVVPKENYLLVSFRPTKRYVGLARATLSLRTSDQSVQEVLLSGFSTGSRPPVPLFNGTDFSGWETFLQGKGKNNDPLQNFSIQDGVIRVVGKEVGYLITKAEYANFRLSVDFRFGEKKWPPREHDKRDAGVCYNIPPWATGWTWPTSIECQIQEGDVGDFWLIGKTTIEVDGQANEPKNYATFTKKRDAEKPGQWNTLEIISSGGTCIHILNGVVVNFGENASVTSGRILLQSEYAEVNYRNVKLQLLDLSDKP